MPRIVLSVAVMTHPSRRHLAEGLIRELQPDPVRLVLDPRPTDPPQTLRTAREAWAAAAPGCTHHLVLQDDAVVPPGFLADVRRTIEARPHTGIALHSDWGSRNGAGVRMAAVIGARWVRAVCDYVPTIALVLPAACAAGLVDFIDAGADPDQPDDVLVADYVRAIDTPVYLTVPNLAGHHDGPSVIGNDVKGRRDAACYVGAPPAGWDPDPARTLEGFTSLPYFKHGRPTILVENDRATNNWSPVPLAAAVDRYGVTEAELRGHLHEELAAAEPWLKNLADRVPADLIWGTWATACLMGLGRSRVEPFRTIARSWGAKADDGPYARSLTTIALGGMFPRISHTAAEDLGTAPRRLAELGLAAGTRCPSAAGT